MSDIWGYVLLGIVLFVIVKLVFGRPRKKSSAPKLFRSPAKRRKRRSAPFTLGYSDKKFEEQWNTGQLSCDGLRCNKKNPCSEPERWFCRDVVSKVIPAAHFIGQFWVDLPSGSRRVDFAIETPAGQRVAVELDGYDAHVENLAREDFDDQLLRQNELACAGWTILRFSFDQLRKNAGQCIRMLQSVITDENASFNRNPVLKGLCPETGCAGTTQRLKSKTGAFFWRCKKCNRTFNGDAVDPVSVN